MASSENRDYRSTVSTERLEAEYKKDKARAKANFSRCKNKLVSLLEEQEPPSRRAVLDACGKMDSLSELATDVLTSFAEFYISIDEVQKSMRVSNELEKILDEYSSAREAATDYLESRQDERSSVTSDILTIDMLEHMNISETNKKEVERQQVLPQTEQEVSAVYANKNNPAMLQVRDHIQTCSRQNENEIKNVAKFEDIRSRHQQQIRDNYSKQDNLSVLDANATPFETTNMHNREAPSLGQDLWRQLKRVEIPVFHGDKRTYQSWKAAFLACIDNAPATPEYKLLQLRQYVSGEALQTIESLGHSATAYEAAKERLERKYGGRRRQIAVYLEDLDNFKQVRTGNARDLEKLADLLDIAIINLKEAGHFHELGDGSLYNKLQRKLSESMLARYHRWVFENSITEGVDTLRKWVIQEAEFQTIAAETMHGLTGKSANNQNREQSLPRHKTQRTFFGESRKDRTVEKTPCHACKGRHAILKCRTFTKKSPTERWRIVKRAQLCYRCLSIGHYGNKCPQSRPCGSNGCKELHHRLLHQNAMTSTSSGLEQTELKRIELTDHTTQEIVSPSAEIATSVTEGKRQEHPQQTTLITQNYSKVDYIALRTVPIILKNGDRSLRVNALLDEASTKSYVNSDVAAELGLKGKTEKVTVNVLNGQIETFETKPVSFELQSVDGKVSFKVNAYTASRVTGDMNVIDWNEYRMKWPHLRSIKFPLNAKRPIVDVLIGLDCLDLHCAIEEVRGQPGEPVARLTPLGWTCIGNPYSVKTTKLVTHFARTYFIRDQFEMEEINSNLKRFWEVEETSLGKPTPIVQIQDQLAMRKVDGSLNYDQNMYRVSIPWKEDKPMLPDNYSMALKRLQNTEKRLQKSPNIGHAYSDIIKQYVAKGYVRKVPENESYSSKWYLPHFPVIRPDKDTTKIRIVFDASAKCQGTSLNDAINQGPKLQRDLFDVLLRFRRFPVAIVCDIAEMYLRIGISPKDQPYHRFLWRGIDQDRRPDVYEFDRVVFGMNSSPFLAQFVLQHHAKKYKPDFPLAAETIDKSTYMDDSMDSVQSETQGTQLYHQLSALLSKAGMHARKWLSNSSKVLVEIPLEDRKAEVDLDRSQLPCAKTLGVWWRADTDVFTFKENVPEEDTTYTKRIFLKKIATLFDPIGFLAPYTIRAKMLLQDMWTAGIDWDDELTEPLSISARAWFAELYQLQQIQVPRCLWNEGTIADTMSLHTFVDASENAYGAVVYARCQNGDGTISTNIVASKTRVSPNIATSIPRLELMGAIVGVRLTTRISNVLGVKMEKVTFWCDSVNVLWWVRGRSRSFKPFVANRVGEIQTFTQPTQWRYVPTKVNPADILSRGMHAGELAECDSWWRGPVFLRESEDVWPKNKVFEVPTGDVEIKHSAPRRMKSIHQEPEVDRNIPCTFVALAAAENYIIDPTNYSSWLKLRRIVAWVNRFIENCKRDVAVRMTGELIADELKRSELQLVRQAQQSEFQDEWKALVNGRSLSSNSKLLALKPQLDDDGLIRSDGRLTNAKFISYDVRHPVILPRKSWVTKLIIKDAHEKGNHAFGTNQTLAVLSARYWIISAREAIREWERECAECRRRKAKASQQIMAPLPLARVQTSLRAFTRTSVDFGGPFITIQGRGFVAPGTHNEQGLEDSSPTQQKLIGNRQLMTDMRAQNFDVIRFATYRTACKLRYIQKKTNLDQVDIWNIIECFRENGLNTLEADTELNASRVEAIVTSIFSQLNKRIPVSRQVDIQMSVNMLLNWLLSAYDSQGHGRVRVFSVKVALSHLCSGKLIDKLRYIFTQISDSSGLLVRQKFEQYLQDILALPTAVFEGPSFGYNDTAVRACFDMKSGVNINNFLNVLVSDPGPQCLMWLPVLHRMAQVENVFHPVQCDGCHRESFMGFRYRCQRCHNYQLCQDCFWRGRSSGYHSPEHQMKEYVSYKSPAKQIGHSIKKSFHCVPKKSDPEKPQFPEAPEKTVDLSYIVPPTPNVVRNGFYKFNKDVNADTSSYDSTSVISRSPGKHSSITTTSTDDEHRLIARYAARLAADVKNAARSPAEMNFSLDTNKAQRELISQLELKNREIMHEIQRLRIEQEIHAKNTAEAQYNPTLMAELRLLRQRKDELENRMQALQESRKDLVMQLESLMKLLKNQPTSPRSTPQDSPRSFSLSPTNFTAQNSIPLRTSASMDTKNISVEHVSPSRVNVPVTSVSNYTSEPYQIYTPRKSSLPPPVNSNPGMESSTLSGLEGEVHTAFSQPSVFSQPSNAALNVWNLRNDLLVAADSITGAMSSLVKELSENSASEDDDDNLNGDLEIVESSMMQTKEDMESWQREIQKRLDQESKFIAELRSKQPHSGTSSSNQSDDDEKDIYLRLFEDNVVVTDDSESYIKTDNDSIVRTDDEDAELYDNHPKELPNEMTSSRYSTEEEGYLQSDAESYIRTDDEDGNNTESDWEESMRRWINR